MTLGVMQPYFLPYIGYWQLMAAVDRFVVYDNIKYTKKGWINRNRFLRDGADVFFTLPLKKGSDSLDVVQREIADDFDPAAMLRQFEASYQRAPQFKAVFPVIESVVRAAPRNLFEYLVNSLTVTAQYLDIKTPLVTSSTVPIDHALKSEQKVIALCQALGANRYINFIGGRELYTGAAFAGAGVELKFIKTPAFTYEQFGQPFVPALSILDVMMFNSRDAIRQMLGDYELV